MRLVTYNIRHARGLDGRISTRRIARVLESFDADVIGLQEVWRWPLVLDQPARLASLLDMHEAFQLNVAYGFYRQGNLVLARGPLEIEESIRLPGLREPRGALVTKVEIHGIPVRFVSTHLSLHRASRGRAIAQLASQLPLDEPMVLAGDMNCGVTELAPLARVLNMVSDPPPTFTSRAPKVAIDHVMYSNHWRLVDLRTADTKASDHLPLFAQLERVT